MSPAASVYLLALAALSLSFVGFTGIIVAVRLGLGAQLSHRHLALVAYFIEGGLAVTALALLPALVALTNFTGTQLWQSLSVVAGLTFTVHLVFTFRRRRRLVQDVERGASTEVLTPLIFTGVPVAILWSNAFGFPYQSNEVLYALALTWNLFLYGLVFLDTLQLFLGPPPGV
jgi:hypothetical protein